MRKIACLLVMACAAAHAATPMLPGYLTDASAGGEKTVGRYVTPEHLRYPYAATYHVEPTVKEGASVTIGYYVTDWAHSKERAKDDSARFDVTVRYSRDCTNWLEKAAKDVKTGDGALDLGPLPVGEWTLSLQAVDRRSGLPSGIVWHEFRVVGRDFFAIPADKAYRVTEKDLAAYGIARLERDYERLVPVPVDEKFAKRRDSWKNRAKDGLKIVDDFIAAHPHADAKTPGYAVYVPTLDGVPVNRSYEMVRIVRDAGYDTNAVAQAAKATRAGLQRLLDEKRAAGFRKVTLPKGVYRVDEKTVKVPAGLTLDLGGATVKLNGFAGCSSMMFAIRSGRDTVLENGTLEGDYFEHDYKAKASQHSEWVCGWEIDSAAWYCEVRDVVTRNIAGYGGSNGSGKDAPGDWLTYSESTSKNYFSLDGKKSEWTAGGYRPDGTYDEKDAARWTSRRLDVTCFVPFKYLTVSKLLGYQGIRTRNWNVTVAYFDAEGKLLKAELVSQYRVSLLPPGAKTARFSVEVASLEEARKCELCVFLLKIPQNCAVRRCRFERCRAVGYAMSACRNWLMEDCDFSYSGEALATCAFDAEDGWDGMQDVTFRRNRFHDNPNNDFLTCAGHNFVYENNAGAIHLWSRTFSPCIRGNDCTTASFCCANRNRTGYGRYGGNTYREGLKVGDDYGLDRDWNIVFDGYDFRPASTNRPFQVQSGGTGLFRNCTFEGVMASPGAAEKCTFRNCHWPWARYNCGVLRDCTFENCSIPRVNATNLYERCTFRNVRLQPVMWGGQYFSDCTMEDLRLPANMPRNVFTGLVTRCTMKGKCTFPKEMVFADDNADRRKTKVMFFFDTEDFTCNESSDAIRETAKILTEEGVRGEYNIVGYLARELVRHNRKDVIDALKPHAIGTQTLGHSVHPTICEMTDMEDYATAYRNALAAETEGVGLLKAAFGVRHVDYAVPPGNSWSYASLYAFADLGMTFYGGGGFGDTGKTKDVSEGLVPPGLRRWGMWYCNLFQLPYGHVMALEELIPEGKDWKLPDFDRVLEESARRDFMVYCLHPHIAIKPAHWDGPNYLGHNRVEWGKWIQITNRPPEATAAFYRNFRAFVKRVKADPRFEVTDTLAEKAKLKARVAIRPADVPAIRAALAKDFGAVSSPASWCLYDVFQAAAAFLRGESEYRPAKAYGFLERPVGVAAPAVVRADDLRAAAKTLPKTGFLPPSVEVGGKRIGPRDFLEAALTVLATGEGTVRLAPCGQLGSFANCPSLEHVDIKGGWCIHSPDLNGKLLDERLKLQLWTLRFE